MTPIIRYNPRAPEETMQQERLAELARQVAELMRGNVPVAARADGSPVVTADGTAAGRAIRLVLSELRRDVPYDSCSVQELRDARLVIIGGVGFANLDVVLGESFPVDSVDIPNGEVLHRRRPFIVGDTEQYRAFRRGLHVGHGIRSWLGVPLAYDDQLLGILALDKSEADFYTPLHAQTATSYASLVAQAMADAEADEAYA
ncbi:MAG TPA: GAF domain-containing protein [Thermoanaerobaculia bacterium]|jgi:GAF domain-containing protein|nr:GAF domain-containing protein [Thermoanaerobaculia bacterium]